MNTTMPDKDELSVGDLVVLEKIHPVDGYYDRRINLENNVYVVRSIYTGYTRYRTSSTTKTAVCLEAVFTPGDYTFICVDLIKL